MNNLSNITIVTGIDLKSYLGYFSRIVEKAFVGFVVTLYLLCVTASAARADVEILHTYGSSLGHEVANVIAVNASKLRPLLPEGYTLTSASSVGFGGDDQGVIVIANFRGIDPAIDHRKPHNRNQVAVDVAILVSEPTESAQAGVSIPGAFHFYTLAIYTNDPRYAASLHRAEIPVEFVNKINYQRNINDATGVGELIVNIPSHNSPFHSYSSGQGYMPMPGAFNAVFWYDGFKGKAVLHFHDQPYQQGTAITRIYTEPFSTWDDLFDGGGLGPCDPHPETGYPCVIAPSLNLRYDKGTVGKLWLIH